MEIQKEVLDALAEWRSAHKTAQEVIAQIMDGKQTGGALHYTAKANDAILELSKLIEAYKVPIINLFPDQEERDQYERYLRVGKFYERSILKKK